MWTQTHPVEPLGLIDVTVDFVELAPAPGPSTVYAACNEQGNYVKNNKHNEAQTSKLFYALMQL